MVRNSFKKPSICTLCIYNIFGCSGIILIYFSARCSFKTSSIHPFIFITLVVVVFCLKISQYILNHYHYYIYTIKTVSVHRYKVHTTHNKRDQWQLQIVVIVAFVQEAMKTIVVVVDSMWQVVCSKKVTTTTATFIFM